MTRSQVRSWLRSLGRSPVAILSGLLVVLLTAWGVTYIAADRSDPGCRERVELRLAVAPAVAPPVQELAEASSQAQPCVTIAIRALPSPQMVAELGAGGTQPTVDAWLPESTFWLRRARAAGAFEVPDGGTSVGGSPVVLALPERSARQLGWPAREPRWAQLLGPRAGQLTVGIPDPAADPVGTTVLLALPGLSAGERDAAAAVAAAMRRLAGHVLGATGGELPEASDRAGGTTAYATTEQTVLGHNLRPGADKYVAAYPPAGLPGLDLPYVVLPGAAEGVREAAADFLDLMLSSTGREAFAAHGFRGPGGSPPSGGTGDRHVRMPELAPVGLPGDEGVTQLLTTWSGVQRSARILAVLDVSGSMDAQVPGTGETRLSATVKAAQEGAGLLLDNSELGVWVFSTRVDGERDYRTVLPVGPLGPRRSEVARKLNEVRVKPNGATGLYDTTLAAYRDARRNWTPGRINLVLIMTDGRNEDSESLSRRELLAELAELRDPRRPLPIIFIGIGDDIDRDELQRIVDVTQGQVFVTEEPAGIRQIFFSALADLACLPPDCRR